MYKVGCWGAGTYAKESIAQMVSEGITIEFFVDSDNKKSGGEFLGYPIISPVDLTEKISGIDILVITTGYRESIFLQCLRMGISCSKIKCWCNESQRMLAFEETYLNKIYSLNSEETLLKEKFADKANGFYVDIGSFHPFRFSNTYWAYTRGWNGMNIEPNMENFELFKVFRPRDINIQCGISNVEGVMKYYRFEEPALNTFDAKCAQFYENIVNCKVKEIVDVQVRRLDNILREKGITKIDFLDIDVEGAEMNVLKSIDFNVDIDCILLEQDDCTLPGQGTGSLQDILNSEQNRFLNERGYEATNKCGVTVMYEKRKG